MTFWRWTSTGWVARAVLDNSQCIDAVVNIGEASPLCSTVDRYADDVHFMGGCLLNDNHWWGAIMLGYQSRPADPLLFGEGWRDNWLKLAVNTRWDWEQNGRSGAVGELEYGRRLDANWSLWGMVGHLLWGEGVKATYGTKVMIGLDRWF